MQMRIQIPSTYYIYSPAFAVNLNPAWVLTNLDLPNSTSEVPLSLIFIYLKDILPREERLRNLPFTGLEISLSLSL